MPIVFIIFILIPIVEITLLIHVGQLIGTWYTIGLVLLSAFIGVNMLRYQGLSTLARAQQKNGSRRNASARNAGRPSVSSGWRAVNYARFCDRYHRILLFVSDHQNWFDQHRQTAF